jgi:broad specificity phosphatase PhoE
MGRLLIQSWVGGIASVYCSMEQKAIDGAEILAAHLSLDYESVVDPGEIDRSSKGYLPLHAFWDTVDSLFSHPGRSVQGWETAHHAWRRIVQAIDSAIKRDQSQGDIAIISHGGVGTLYLCHLEHCPIDRSEGQPSAHGGCYHAFDADSKALLHGWKMIDA